MTLGIDRGTNILGIIDQEKRKAEAMGTVEQDLAYYMDMVEAGECEEAQYQEEIELMFEGRSEFKTLKEYLEIILVDDIDGSLDLVTDLVSDMLLQQPEESIKDQLKMIEKKIKKLLYAESELREEYGKYKMDSYIHSIYNENFGEE